MAHNLWSIAYGIGASEPKNALIESLSVINELVVW